jgi:geranylgeranyl pyrophosphate synthase
MNRAQAAKQGRLELNQIYAPIEKDLKAVEATIQATSSVPFPHLAGLLDHLLKGDGKRIRPALTLLAGKFYEYHLDTLVPMAAALELLHTATLVHDDAIDHSLVRRNKPTVNKLWGEEQAVLLGDYLFAEAGCLTATTNNLRVIKLFSSTLKIISSGEIDQAINAFSLNLSKADYYQRITKKTATLFTTSTESGAVLSNAPEEAIQRLVEYGLNLGIAFQVVDDILDFAGTEQQLGKPTGSDLIQGTVTLPVILLIERYPAEATVKQLFLDHNNPDITKSAIEMVRNSPGIIDECYRIAMRYCDRAIASLDPLPANNAKEGLGELARYIVYRSK